MFDIGFGEIFLIAIVALLVLGPERLPKAARFAGLWVRRARSQWYSVKAELENELADDELRRSLKQTQADLLDARDSLAQSGAALKQQIEETGTEVRDAFQSGVSADDVAESDHEAPLGSASELEELELPADDEHYGMRAPDAHDADELDPSARERASGDNTAAVREREHRGQADDAIADENRDEGTPDDRASNDSMIAEDAHSAGPGHDARRHDARR